MLFLFEAYLTMVAVAGLIVAGLLIPAALLVLAQEGFQKLVALLPRPAAIERPAEVAVAVAPRDFVQTRN